MPRTPLHEQFRRTYIFFMLLRDFLTPLNDLEGLCVTTVTRCHECETKCGSCATADAFEKCGAQMRRPHFSNASTLNVPTEKQRAIAISSMCPNCSWSG